MCRERSARRRRCDGFVQPRRLRSERPAATDRDFVQRAHDQAMTNVIARQSPARLRVVVIGVAVVTGESREFIASVRVVLELGPGVVGLELQSLRVTFLNTHIHAVVLGGSNVGIQNLYVGELRERPQRLRLRRVGGDLSKVGIRNLVDAVLATGVISDRQAMAEGTDVADIQQQVRCKFVLNAEARLIEVAVDVILVKVLNHGVGSIRARVIKVRWIRAQPLQSSM